MEEIILSFSKDTVRNPKHSNQKISLKEAVEIIKSEPPEILEKIENKVVGKIQQLPDGLKENETKEWITKNVKNTIRGDKLKLPFFLTSCYMKQGHAQENIELYNGCVQVDIDCKDKNGVELARKYKDVLRQDPHFLFLAYSPSKIGLKGLIKTDNTKPDSHNEAVKQINEYLAKKYDIALDFFDSISFNTPAFVPFDKDVHVNFEASVFKADLSSLKETITASPKRIEPIKETVKFKSQVYDERLSNVIGFCHKYKIDPTANYKDWVKIGFGCIASLKNAKEAFLEISKLYPAFNNEEASKTFDSLKLKGKSQTNIFNSFYRKVIDDEKAQEHKDELFSILYSGYDNLCNTFFAKPDYIVDRYISELELEFEENTKTCINSKPSTGKSDYIISKLIPQLLEQENTKVILKVPLVDIADKFERELKVQKEHYSINIPEYYENKKVIKVHSGSPYKIVENLGDYDLFIVVDQSIKFLNRFDCNLNKWYVITDEFHDVYTTDNFKNQSDIHNTLDLLKNKTEIAFTGTPIYPYNNALNFRNVNIETKHRTNIKINPFIVKSPVHAAHNFTIDVDNVIIFLNSKKMCRRVYEIINAKKKGYDISIYDSENSNNKLVRWLKETERFPSGKHILITTKKLSLGLNINGVCKIIYLINTIQCNKSIKANNDFLDFIQSIERKRGDKVVDLFILRMAEMEQEISNLNIKNSINSISFELLQQEYSNLCCSLNNTIFLRLLENYGCHVSKLNIIPATEQYIKTGNKELLNSLKNNLYHITNYFALKEEEVSEWEVLNFKHPEISNVYELAIDDGYDEWYAKYKDELLILSDKLTAILTTFKRLKLFYQEEEIINMLFKGDKLNQMYQTIAKIHYEKGVFDKFLNKYKLIEETELNNIKEVVISSGGKQIKKIFSTYLNISEILASNRKFPEIVKEKKEYNYLRIFKSVFFDKQLPVNSFNIENLDLRYSKNMSSTEKQKLVEKMVEIQEKHKVKQIELLKKVGFPKTTFNQIKKNKM